MAASLPPANARDRGTLPALGNVNEQHQPRRELHLNGPDESFPSVFKLEGSTTATKVRKASEGGPSRDSDEIKRPISAREYTHRKVDAERPAIPTRPASARKTGANPRQRRPSVLGEEGDKRTEVIPIRKRSPVVVAGRVSGGRTKSKFGDRIELPWEPYQKICKAMKYRPRGHGREFVDSYDLGPVLGAGGFAEVREGGSNQH